MTLIAGARLGPYEIVAPLGAGGMGTVFKARHRRMKRIVALKVLSAEISRDPLFVKRFQREVETIARTQIERILPLSQAAEAHRLVEAGKSQGKIVLDPTLG